MFKWKLFGKRKDAFSEKDLDLHERLSREHEKFMYAYARRLSRSDSEAQTIVSDAWYILLRKEDELETIINDPVRTRSYIARVILYQSKRITRDNAVRSKYEELYRQINTAIGTEPAAGEAAERRLRHREFVQAIEKLPDPFREVILMRYYEGKSSEEIAAQLGIAPGSVNQYAKRAREKLKAILIENQTIEEGDDYDRKV